MERRTNAVTSYLTPLAVGLNSGILKLSSAFLAFEDSDDEQSNRAPNLLSAAVDEGACQVPGGLGPALRVLRAELAVYA